MRLTLFNVPLKDVVECFRLYDKEMLAREALREGLTVNDAQLLEATGEMLARFIEQEQKAGKL